MSAGIKANNDGSGAIQVGGSDYITISSAGAVAIPQTLSVPTIKSATSATPPTIQDSAGTQIGTFCRAWVNFNGATVTNPASMTGVRGSFNVSSVLDNGTGDYTVNFTTAMPDVNYSPQISCGTGLGDINGSASMLTGSCRFRAYNDAGTSADPAVVSIAIFR